MGVVFSIAALFALSLVIVGSLHILGVAPHPGEKRTHLFETEDGERYNPLSSDSEGSPTGVCDWCGERNDSDYEFCESCTRPL